MKQIASRVRVSAFGQDLTEVWSECLEGIESTLWFIAGGAEADR